MATKIKNIPFIGGDTMEFEFDFGTKVFGSVAECPMRLYTCTMSSLQSPANKTGTFATGWEEIIGSYGGQDIFDKLKSQDNWFTNLGYLNNGSIMQIMVELDLTQLCTVLFGGSNSAMKAAIKEINIDAWVCAFGAKDGVKTAACAMTYWGADNKWGSILNPGNTDWVVSNISSTPTKLSSINLKESYYNHASQFITSDNKLFILLYGLPSNGTIASEVDLDYINIKLQFARVPDVISSIPITLPDTWSMVIKGLAFAYDSSFLSNPAYDICALNPDSNNANYDLAYQSGKFMLDNWDGFTAESLWSETISFVKFQVINILVEQTVNGIRMRILKNTDSIKKYFLNSSRNFKGEKNLYILSNRGSLQADAFINSIIFLPDKNFDDDTEAESILKGTAIGYEEDELVTDGTFQNGLANYPDHSASGISVSPGKILFTALGTWVDQTINVFPNNQYHLDKEGNCSCVIQEFYNNVLVKSTYLWVGDIVTTNKTNNLRISLYPTEVGQYCTSVSLKLKM